MVLEQVHRKRMTNEGDGTSSIPNVRTDGGKKNKKGKKQQVGNEPNLPGLPPSVPPPSVFTPSKGQTSLPPQIINGVTKTPARSPWTLLSDRSGLQGSKWRGKPLRS